MFFYRRKGERLNVNYVVLTYWRLIWHVINAVRDAERIVVGYATRPSHSFTELNISVLITLPTWKTQGFSLQYNRM